MAKRAAKKVRPLYQYEYDRVMRAFREKRKLMRRLLDIMDQDESGHDWPGIWWTETVNDLKFLALHLAMMREASRVRDEVLEPVSTKEPE